jgi:hypothetical protein
LIKSFIKEGHYCSTEYGVTVPMEDKMKQRFQYHPATITPVVRGKNDDPEI